MLKNLEPKSKLSHDIKHMIAQYNIVIEDICSEIELVYQEKINDFLVQIEQQHKKNTRTILYKETLQTKREEMLRVLNKLDGQIKTLHEKQRHLLNIEKIGQSNNEKLSKIKDSNYDEILHKNLMEQYDTMNKEYEIVLNLEHSIKDIPFVKKELVFLQDKEVEFTEQKISILHIIENN